MLESQGRESGGGGKDPEELAADLLARRGAGEQIDVEGELARLPNEAARRDLRDLLAAASQAERGLPRAISAGSRIAGRYRILEPIGSGGMGRVFSAIDEKLSCKVAVKVLAPLAEGNREREEMFRKESLLLADLKHPGIVAVHDAGSDGELTYIVMDLVEGLALSEVLDRARTESARKGTGTRLGSRDGEALARAIGRAVPDGRPDLIESRDWYRSCARILREIARTLEAAHGRKVVHRDLKPANVMLLGGGTPVVLDFGLAGSPEVSTGAVTEALYGSVAYLAPEQALSHKVGMDPRTDVYQLGLILYEMLTVRRAFPGTAVGDVLKRIGQGYYEAPRKLDPAVPRDLEAICTMALELSPEKRYQTARALREDLERWLEGRAPLASRSARWRSLARTTRYTARRHPMLTAAAGIAFVGLSVAGYSWKRGVESVPPAVSIVPFRLDKERTDITWLDGRGKHEIRDGEWLGVRIESSHENFVYTLSVFGAEDFEERRVSPWKTAFPDEPERPGGGKGPFGLRVPEGVHNLLCTQINETSLPKTVEGLLVLASPVERPEVEAWMRTRLAGGVPYPEARSALLSELTTVTRGNPPAESRSFSKEERVMLVARLSSPQGGGPGSRLGLPGVKECEVECRVAGP